MREAGAKETHRGTPWSRNCREWVYFDRPLDAIALKARLSLPACVSVHEHIGTHDGHEAGLVCEECHDAVMGPHPSRATLPIVR